MDFPNYDDWLKYQKSKHKFCGNKNDEQVTDYNIYLMIKRLRVGTKEEKNQAIYDFIVTQILKEYKLYL